MVAEYALAETVEEAARLVAEDPEAIVMGGGTTLIPRVTLGELNGRRVIGLARANLDYVHRNGATTLGAMAPLRAAAELGEAPALAQAAGTVGSWQLRTTATVGGNLLAPQPYGDLVPALLALDAELVIAGEDGARRAALAEALAEESVVRPGELLTEVVVPEAKGTTSFARCARRAAAAPPVATAAVRIRRDGDGVAEARVALGAVGPRALRATAAEQELTGSGGEPEAVDAAVRAAADAVTAADDSVASAWYRKKMVELHTRRAIESALEAG